MGKVNTVFTSAKRDWGWVGIKFRYLHLTNTMFPASAPLSASEGTDSWGAEVSTYAKRPELEILRFRLELTATAASVQVPEDGCRIMFSCERRGIVLSTGALEISDGQRDVQFGSSIVLDMLVGRHPGYDPLDTDGKNAFVNQGPTIDGLEDTAARITFREENAAGTRGPIVDCAAVNLSRFLVGMQGRYDMPVEMQLGSTVVLRGDCELQGGAGGRANLQAEEYLPGSDLASGPVEKERKDDEHHQTTGRPRVSTVSVDDQQSVEEAPVAQDTDCSANCPGGPQNEAENGSCRAPLHTGAAGVCSENFSPDKSNISLWDDLPVCSSSEDDSQDGGPPNLLETNAAETDADDDDGNDNGDGKHLDRKEQDDDSEAKSDQESGQSDEEDQEEDEDEDEDRQGYEWASRTRDIDHPFDSLITSAVPVDEEYSCLVDEGPWTEVPVISEVSSPLPLTIWSIQGPEEIDPDDIDEMMDIGDGQVGPRRSIAKLRAVAACSATKQGPPALPGTMSPLQKTWMRPSGAREAVVIALGTPPAVGHKQTVLAASRAVSFSVIDVEEPPDLTDSENGGSGDDEFESEDGSEDGSGSSSSFAIDLNEEGGAFDADGFSDLISQVSNSSLTRKRAMRVSGAPVEENVADGDDDDGPGDVNDEMDNLTPVRSTQEIEEHQKMQIRGLEAQVEDLEAEFSGVDLVVKREQEIVKQLQEERSRYKELVIQKDMQLFDFNEAGGEVQGRIATVRKENAELQHKMDEVAAEIGEIETAARAAGVEAAKLRAELGREVALERENERLQVVVGRLEDELLLTEHKREAVDLLVMAKSELAMERANCQMLRHDVAKLKSKSGVRIGSFFKMSKASST